MSELYNRVKWLIQDDVFPESIDSLVDAVKKAGYEYKFIKTKELYQDLDVFDKDSCVIFIGSLQQAKNIQRTKSWIPGTYYNVPQFNCNAYYSKLGKYLLNDTYTMLPFGELERQRDRLYEIYGIDNTIFLRPNRGDKLFTGQIVYKEHFTDTLLHRLPKIDSEELVIVSEPRNIIAEWRFIVVNGEIVTGSQYKKNDRFHKDVNCPSEAIEFAKQILFYNPDNVWVIDVCKTAQNEYRLMEVGCFSCAGQYDCDKDIIVDRVSKQALKDWQEAYG